MTTEEKIAKALEALKAEVAELEAKQRQEFERHQKPNIEKIVLWARQSTHNMDKEFQPGKEVKKWFEDCYACFAELDSLRDRVEALEGKGKKVSDKK